MHGKFRILSLLLFATFVTTSNGADAQAGVAPDAPSALVADVAGATQAFLDTLAPERRARANLPFQSRERTIWRYTPGPRAGLALQDMARAERDAAHAVLRSFLSAEGYVKVESIIALETILRELEAWNERDPLRYWFAVYGTPGPEAPWSVRMEGHHVSLHLTVAKGRIASSTPTFLGANPAEVREGPRRGERVLRAEEDHARALLDALTPAQRREAVVSTGTYGDIVTRNGSRVEPLEQAGVAYAALAPAQRQQLLGLIELHASTMKQPLAAARLDRIRAAGLDGIRFAWVGATERGRGHYYRIQGPTFLIEFDNSGGNHVHTVWRDFAGDFGRDVLREHYGTSAHAADGRHVPRR